MNSSKLTLGILILGSTLVTGCASKSQFDKLSSNIQTLNTKVNKIHDDIDVMRSDVQAVKDDANRANQRLDNQASRYRK